MKTTTSHIPPKRLNDINFIVKVIKEELGKKLIEIEKIILFGSYARGDFVEKDIHQVGHHTEVYRSDFDIMIITKKDLGEEAEGLAVYITDKIYKKHKTEAPITLIIEDLRHVNNMLEMGRYFYADIKNEGIVLLDNSGIELAEKKILTKKERQKMMKEDFDLWFPSANKFYELFKSGMEKGFNNESAFLLHQTAEKFMTAYLLVKTGYKGRTHDLLSLYDDLMRNHDDFKDWFNIEDKEEFRLFKLLREAYVRARYDKDYSITKEELEFLEKKVLILRDLVEGLCLHC